MEFIKITTQLPDPKNKNAVETLNMMINTKEIDAIIQSIDGTRIVLNDKSQDGKKLQLFPEEDYNYFLNKLNPL